MNLNATILGQTISFVLFVWFCMKYVWPPIISAIETRQKEIKKSLIDSKKAQEELCLIQNKIQGEIKQAKEKASIIMDEANTQKLLILEKARKEALEERQKILTKTQLEIDIQILNARRNLRKDVADLSISIAEKIIKRNISKDTNQNLVDELINSLLQVKN